MAEKKVLAGKQQSSKTDQQRSVAHLADTISENLAHAQRHIYAGNSAKTPEAKRFNEEHAVHHLAAANEHAKKLQQHLKEHPVVASEFKQMDKARAKAGK